MKSSVAFLFALAMQAMALVQVQHQPEAVSAQSDKPAKPPGYRNAWDDCGGAGASATERMRGIAAKIKGWAKPIPFVRNAAQDCNKKDGTGTDPGPGEGVVYPGPEIHKSIREGLRTAANTLAKYPAK